MFDGAVTGQLVEVQTRGAGGVGLAGVAQTEASEQVGDGVAEEGPEARGRRGEVFEVGGVDEGVGDGGAEADEGDGGAEFVGLDVAAVAGEVAVVGEGVDDGAGAAEVGGEGGGVGAAVEGARGGWGGHGLRLVDEGSSDGGMGREMVERLER